MPGILLNRLSRAKEGMTAEEQLAKGRGILLEQMLPAICPDGKSGEDFIYLEDIISRLEVHKEGEILDRAFKLIRKGCVDWIAVTEIPRLSGDLATMGQIVALCREHRIRIYTLERLHHPFEPWRAQSEQELSFYLFQSMWEVLQYRGRYERARDGGYPINAQTRANRMTTMKGLGRHINGRVPLGYVWSKEKKRPEPDRSVPNPDFVPEGATDPAALSWFDIVKRVRELGLLMGAPETAKQIAREAGVQLEVGRITAIWDNEFYAGRPTSRYQRRGGRVVRKAREEFIQTVGDYEAVDTLEDHQALREAVHERATKGRKYTSLLWASGLIRCACGQPWIGHSARRYGCRGLKRSILTRQEENREPIAGIKLRIDRHRPLDDWQQSPTCGYITSDRVHAHIERELRTLFSRTYIDVPGRVERWEELQPEARSDRDRLTAAQEEIRQQLLKIREREERAMDLAIDGTITKDKLEDVRYRVKRERAGLEARSKRLAEEAAAPVPTAGVFELLRRLLTVDFDSFWAEATTDERARIAAAFIEYIPIHGERRPGFQSREFGAVVWNRALGLTEPGSDI